MLTQKRCRYGQKIKKFTIADRLAILHEYETSDLTGAEIARKYGLNSGSTISTWKRRLYNSKKVVPLQAKTKEAEQWKMQNVNNY
jgi:transposase-like protein